MGGDIAGLQVAVVGGGPAGLMASEALVHSGAKITVFDQMPSVGRKFLLAGRGGLNLTHSEPLDRLRQRDGRAEPHLRGAIERLPPDGLLAWAAQLGQTAVVGSVGRGLPQAIKPAALVPLW